MITREPTAVGVRVLGDTCFGDTLIGERGTDVMGTYVKFARGIIAAAAVTLVSGTALADGWYDGSVKDSAPMAEGRKLEFSASVTGTSDYIFRGFSQTDEDPAAQASLDVTYGIFYAGLWGSNVDSNFVGGSSAEVDLYAGIKPVWGPVTFDLGVIYYWYPGDEVVGGNEQDYVELKAGYSIESPWIKGLTSGTTVYWSPDYALEQGEVFTVESAASYALPKVGIFSPSISGVFGTVYGDAGDGFVPLGIDAEDEYSYWNAGLELAVENITFDFRYWDTDVKGDGLADERFVFSTTISLP